VFSSSSILIAAGLVLALGVATYLTVSSRAPTAYQPPPPPKQPEPRDFTAEDLAQYTGANGKPVYLSLKNIVYEVSPSFYGPGMGYSVFAGVDCTIPLARSDISRDGANQDWSVLTKAELEVAGQWEDKFQTKYPDFFSQRTRRHQSPAPQRRTQDAASRPPFSVRLPWDPGCPHRLWGHRPPPLLVRPGAGLPVEPHR